MASFFSNSKIEDYLKDSKGKSYFTIAVTIVFIVVVLIAGIFPAYSAIASQNRENDKRRLALESLTTKVETLRSLVQQESTKEDVIELFNSSFPSETQLQEDLIRAIADAISNNNVGMKNIGFSESDREVPLVTELGVNDQVKSATVSIAVEGRRADLVEFTKDLETTNRILNIHNYALSRKSAGELENITNGFDYDLSLQAEFYYWSNEVEL